MTMISTAAAAAVAGKALDRGLAAANLAARQRSSQTIKSRASGNRTSVKARKRGRVGLAASQREAGDEHDGADLGQAPSDSSAAPQGNSETVDVLACIAAFLPKGSNARADIPSMDIIRGFNTVVGALRDKAAIQDASEIEMKLRPVAEAYDRILDDIKKAKKSKQKNFPDKALKDVDMAEDRATELYEWAKRIVSDRLRTPEAMTKQAKLQMVPYIVALAYATRIRAVTRLVNRDMANRKKDKEKHLNRSREVVDEFIAVVHAALEGLMADTSLVEIALDYELPMAMYLTLMTSFRASMDAIKSPSTEINGITAWDDGLSSIREALHWEPSGADAQAQGRVIFLNNLSESLWWARFENTDFSTSDVRKLRRRIDIRELSHMFGVGSDSVAAKLALKPGRKSALLRLQPAHALRDALCAKIAQACQAAHADRPSPTPPPSFARIGAPPPPLHLLRSAVAIAPGRLRADAPRTLDGHPSIVYDVAVCADGDRVLSGGADGTARVWSLSTGATLYTLLDHENDVNCVAASPDGKTAVSGSDDKSVCVWNLESGRLLHTLHGHSERVWTVAMSPDGRTIASGSKDTTLKLWSVDTGHCIDTLIGHARTVFCAAFSPDGETLVSGGVDKSIRVWNVCTGKLKCILHGHCSDVLSVAVTPDGRRLVSGSADGTVRVWNLRSRRVEVCLKRKNSGSVFSVAVFPDGKRVVSGGGDGNIRVWDLRKGTLDLKLMGHSHCVESIAVSPDGRTIVSGSRDKTIKVWGLSDGDEGAAR